MPERRLLILGAGFGGVFAAKRLRRRLPGDVAIEIVDDNNYFVFQPLLPEVAGGSVNVADAVVPLRSLLPGVTIREATILGIDLAERRVEVQQGMRGTLHVLACDHLVIALGQTVDLRRYPGLGEHALRMKDLADAFRLRNHVIDCLEQADIAADPELKRRLLTFVVVGGGLSGVETVGEIHDMIARALTFYPRINRRSVRMLLVEYQPRILPEVADGLAEYAARRLSRRGIEVITGVGVKSASRDAIELTDGRVVDAMTVVATVGNGPSPLVESLPVDRRRGRIVADRHLRVPGYEGVWTLGDAAWVPAGRDDEAATPPTAQAAVQQAEVLAANIQAATGGGALAAFEYRRKGQLASLGGRRGVADVYGFELSGFFAWVMWRFFYLVMLPGFATKVRVAVDWMLDALFPRNLVQIQQPSPQAVRKQRFRAGDVVYERGEVAGPLYLVVEGRLRRTSPGEEEAVLETGSLFGDGALHGERLRRATVTALENSYCLALERADLELLAGHLERLGLCLAGSGLGEPASEAQRGRPG